MLLGILVGLAFGVAPGLGGITAMAILVPLTYKLGQTSAFALLIGAASAVAFGGSVSAILINTPGTNQSVATCLDGYPMTRSGEGRRAIGISATASALGGVVGAIVLLALIPVMHKVVLAFAPPEYFMLCLLGLTAIAGVSGKTMLKGLVMGGLGILLSFVGYDPVTGTLRYTFNALYLYDGIDVVAAVIGLFAIAEMMSLMVEGSTIVSGNVEEKPGGLVEGMKDVFRHWWLFLRSSVIGTVIGIIPGIGGGTANVVAYSHAVQTSRCPERFGTGVPEGVIAPESANNASFGGALVPTVAFGIPGSEMCVVLLGAFMLHGLVPGPEMLKEHLDLVFQMAWGVAFANIIASLIGVAFMSWLVRLCSVRVSLLAPSIIAISLLGAFATSGNVADVLVALVFGIFGYWMKKLGYPRAPLMIGLVLGGLAEVNLHLSLQIYGLGFVLRPIALVILALILVFAFGPAVQRVVAGRRRVEA
jgi:TctA family transporter